MHITWHGNHTVKIQAADKVIVIDPYAPTTGLPPLRSKADIVTLTAPANPAMSHLNGLQGEPNLINTPGEYALSGFTLHALGWQHTDGSERSLLRWQIEDMVLLHVGALNRDLTDQELQELEKTTVDIFFVPVGGDDSLDSKQAQALVMKIEPRVVIPINFRLPKQSGKLEAVDQFAKAMGVGSREREKKLTIRAKHVPHDEMMTVVLAP